MKRRNWAALPPTTLARFCVVCFSIALTEATLVAKCRSTTRSTVSRLTMRLNFSPPGLSKIAGSKRPALNSAHPHNS
ncbi:hypothetical protein [Streptomyces tauricus]|uniref:hypothetical protein n=1 Tax=Streptomyces tauricus TaxID=68274 RepID=UPI0022447E0E|nr:hypothetical protein [Streptomyces tauricus]MCW8103237.1 hypothetical protein [Streptomyces tauricus]